MRLAILGLSALVISVPLSAETSAEALGHPNQLPVAAAAAGGSARVQIETRAVPPTARPTMVRLPDGAVFLVTSTAKNDASTANAAGQALPEHGESRFSQSFRNWIASERAPEVAHVSWSRASDLLGRPIDFSRPIRSFGRSQNLLPAFLPGYLPSSLPVAAMGLTSGFGMRDHPLLGLRRAHLGIDLAAPSGSPIVATSDGVVSVADWRGGYGLLVALEHGRGIETRYGHMSRLNVAAGQAVHKGDVIGFVGSTGLSTGPHLHYEVRINGQPVNPAPLLRP